MFEALKRLHGAGVRYASAIDIGCADGGFLLEARSAGLLDGAATLNIDANSLYEPSLAAIKQTVGGHYWIGAVTDREGDIEMTVGAHPYWTSVRPAGDLYWTRINELSADKITVPTKSLDQLVGEFGLVPPHLIKLDVQGAEASVLSGASDTLRGTSVVVCEADIADFQDLNELLVKAGFVLHDVTLLNRDMDGYLGWFYPIFARAELDVAKPRSFWRPEDNARVIGAQVERRQAILKRNAELLRRLGNKTAFADVGRNALCPCGSGRKYKHCCGAHTAAD